jgi:multicomponent Na+:H+ antiporter subunit D
MTAADAAPLAVAVPLLGSAVVAALVSVKAARLAQAVAISAATVTGVLCAILMHASRSATLVYWFGGWHPRNGVAIGVDFAVDPLGAGFALLAALLVTVGLVCGIGYFDGLGQVLFAALMLTLLAGMVGFSLSGDVFDMFAFFSVVNVSAIALTVHQNEDEAAIQGAINFAVSNAAGALLILVGIALLYGETGGINLAQIGRAAAEHPAAGATVVGLAAISAGLFTKAGVVPFHFWLVDAYAAAPTPVVLVFPGVMCELGLLGFVRVLHLAGGSLIDLHATGVSDALLAAGVITAVVGSLTCLVQHHLKRLLAFATVAHIGVFLIGIGLLDAESLGGTGLWVVGDACAKGALFIVAGYLVRTFGSADIGVLHGKGRHMPVAGALFTVGALIVMATPPSLPFLGKSAVDAAADQAGRPWVPLVLLLVSATVGGALLAAGARIFLGAGARHEGASDEAGEPGGSRPSAAMLTLSALLLVIALLLPFAPDLTAQAHRAGEHVTGYRAYADRVLNGHRQDIPLREVPALKPKDWVLGFAATVVGLVVACALLMAAGRGRTRLARLSEAVLRTPYTGRTGDQLAWLAVGAAATSTAFALAVR